MLVQCRASMASRRGTVIIVVLWALAVAALVTTGVQLFSFRQATLGREAVERIQARWAARAGVEYTIAVMADHTNRPDPEDAFSVYRDMNAVAAGDTYNASWDIRHHRDGRDVAGPLDEHSKININRADDRSLLMVFDDMTYDIYDAIKDWTDEDDDVSAMGVEREYYQSLASPYEPRNGALHTMAELEMIAGVWPKDFRGEDWNLNGRLDPNEDDGPRSFPPDDSDGILNAGWSGSLTVYSVTGGPTASGKPRIYLSRTEADEVADRLGISAAQAESLITYGKNKSNKLERLMTAGLSASDQPTAQPPAGMNPDEDNAEAKPDDTGDQKRQTGSRNGSSGAGAQSGAPVAFTTQETRAIIDETTMDDPNDRLPGKMNINTTAPLLLRDILEKGMSMDEALVDEIIYMRDSRPEGIVYLGDLQKIPGVTSQILESLAARFTTTSSVFTISSKGRSWASGLEVEIIAVVDRSTVPVRILEYREQ
jgi:hypothetical protein